MMMVVVTLMTTINVIAQRIQTVDDLGNPISYATVTNTDNDKFIGTTDLQGVLADVKGAQKLYITHIAFKPQEVNVSELKNGVITLQESDYDLPEIVVEKKGYIYVQTYYRLFCMMGDTLGYYRSGITNNIYDIEKKKVSAKYHHFSKAFMGVMKFMLDMMLGSVINQHSELPTLSKPSATTVALEGGIPKELSLVEESPNRQRIDYNGKPIGYMVDDETNHQRRISIDNAEFSKLKIEEHGSKKQKKRFEERKSKTSNKESSRYIVYRMNEGTCNVEDFVSLQVHDDFDQYDPKSNKNDHIRMWLEIFVTDRAYVTKEEAKERKSNRIPMTFESLQQFERQHSIAPIPANTLKALKELVE